MKRNLVKVISCVLSCMMLATFVACNPDSNQNNNVQTTDTEAVETTDAEATTDESDQSTDATIESSDSTSEQTTEKRTEATTAEDTETTEPIDTEIYENGAEVEGAGAFLGDNFATVEHPVDEGAAIKLSAAEFKEMLAGGALESGKVYAVDGIIRLPSDNEFDGNGAAVISADGIYISKCENVSVRNIIVVGQINISDSVGIALASVDVRNDDVAISVTGSSIGVSFDDCRIVSDTLAMSVEASGAVVNKSYLSAPRAIEIIGDANQILGCHVVATSLGVSVSGDSNIIRGSSVETASDGVGIAVLQGSQNTLVALNSVSNSQSSITVTESFNTVVLLNSAIRVKGGECTSLYVVSNSLGGRLDLRDNNYLLCDANVTPEDSKEHNAISVRNENTNGDNITDINERAEVGVNENILPHTNKDLFIGMERKSGIYVHDEGKELTLGQYICRYAQSSEVVIVPPGAYKSSFFAFNENHSNTTIYAYGAMHEMQDYGQAIAMNYVENMNIHGLTVAYSKQSSCQIHVIDKLGSNRLLVVPAAGYENTITNAFPGWYPKENDGSTALYPIALLSHKLEWNEDGTGVFTLLGQDTTEYFNIKVGDVVTTRFEGGNTNSIGISNTNNLLLKDMVMYGYSNAMAIVVQGESSGIKIDRFHNTASPSPLISKEIYEKYTEWEKEYDVDLEIYVDEKGNCRGSLPRLGSVDATHLVGTLGGLDVTNTILENMTDDGSNHRSSSSRLHAVTNNGDGTTTIYYKGYVAELYHNSGAGLSNCSNFKAGERIFVVAAASGKVLCDTVCLSDAVAEKEKLTFTVEDKTYTTTVWAVTVDSDNVDMSAIEGLDLSDNSYAMAQKVIVDNISRNSVGFRFDNVLIRNTSSRGILVKTRDAEILNCTFQNLAHAGIVVDIESVWGESTIAQNVKIDKCVFDHIGYIDRLYTYTTIAPITIRGFGTDVANVELPCHNISVNGCEFKNNLHRYAICVVSAQDVSITNNTFHTITASGREALGISVYMVHVKALLLEGNTYPHLAPTVRATVSGYNYMGITGADTLDENGETVFPDNLN